MRKITAIPLVLLFVSFSFAGTYSGGTGVPGNPYQIAAKADLLSLAADTNDYSKCFILTADINLASAGIFTTAVIARDTSNAKDELGNDDFNGVPFTGIFDGAEHKIISLTINTSGVGNSYLGLFGCLGPGGEIKNLGVENSTITGGDESMCLGGLAGDNDSGNISSCYSKCNITGGNVNSSQIGGLVGHLYNGSIISCYSTGAVSGYIYIGGLAGLNAGDISNCYSTGDVSGIYSGGLVGWNFYDSGSISNCYSTGSVTGGGLVGINSYENNIISSYFLTTSGIDNGNGTPLTDVQMKQQSSFINWDFINETVHGTCNYWQMATGGYPVLSSFNGNIPEPSGSGTENDPYVITDANGLGTIWYRPTAHYILANDIDLEGIQWTAAVIPLFSGSLNGDGFCIRNLSINGREYLGLFGLITSGGSVKNLGLKDCAVSNYDYAGGTGGLAGYNDGEISNCYSTGAVSGDSYIGGMVGTNQYGTLTDCWASSSVTGGYGIGGLAGLNNYGSISNCYSTGNVSGTIYEIGGLVGANDSGSVANSFWDVNTSGRMTSAGGTGKTTTQMKTRSTFTSAGWDFTNETANGTNDFWRMCVNGVNYPKLNWESMAGDFACPDGVKMEDLNYFARQWLLNNCALSNNYCNGTDMNHSGTVNMLDFAEFAENWMLGT